MHSFAIVYQPKNLRADSEANVIAAAEKGRAQAGTPEFVDLQRVDNLAVCSSQRRLSVRSASSFPPGKHWCLRIFNIFSRLQFHFLCSSRTRTSKPRLSPAPASRGDFFSCLSDLS
jgi:hypothetical protein